MNKTQLIRDFITKSKLKSKIAIAKAVFEKYPDKFKSVEDARTLVRYVTGSLGNNLRNDISNPELTKFFYNGFESWAKENLNTELRPWDDPFVIPDSIKVLNVIADLHSIHLDVNTYKAFLNNTKDKTALLINGDLLDSEQLTRHLKSHNAVEYEKELEICHTILKALKSEFNHVYFKAGNHDYWLERYLLNNAREIFRLRGIQVQELLRCGELGVHFIHNLKYIQYGDLDIVHGHEFGGFGGGKFPSVSLLDKWQTFKGRYDVKILASHSHRNDHSISRKSKDGKFGESWVTPAMCRKGAGYAPYSGWDNGWCVLQNNNGKVDVQMIVI
ncbi:MAG: hypothetical protein RLZZ86_45 [Cyanobacteriota bacterium]|jgi:hypothetical protein